MRVYRPAGGGPARSARAPRGAGESVAALLLAAALACGRQGPPAPAEESIIVPRGGSVTIYVEAPRRNAGPILKTFTEQSGIEVHAVYREALGEEFLPQLKSAAVAGQVDLFWGASPLAALELASEGFAVPFRPAGARPIPSQFLDPAYRWIGFALNPRVIIYNNQKMRREEAPTSISDMTQPPWGGRGAVARIREGPSAFHASALVTLWGADRARDFLAGMRRNGTRIVEDDAAVRKLVASGEALWGIVGLDEAICSKREAEPVHIFFPDRLSSGAVAVPYVMVLMQKAPHPAQAKGLYAYLFSTEASWQLGENDCALVTLLPDIPRPDWVPGLGSFNLTRLDNQAVYAAYLENRPLFASWGAPETAAEAPKR